MNQIFRDSSLQVDPKSRFINGVEYTVIHYTPRLQAGFTSGNYLLAKDYSLLIENRLMDYPSESTHLEFVKEQEIVERILNSVKKI